MKTIRSAADIRADIQETTDQLHRTQSWKRRRDLKRHLQKLKRDYITARVQEGRPTCRL